MLTISLVLATLALGHPVPAVVQRPNFTGRWVLERSDPPVASAVEVVRHEGNILTVGNAGNHGSTYRLDGTESRTTTADVEVISTTRWEDNRLVILRTENYKTGFSRRTRQIWEMSGQRRIVTYFDMAEPEPRQTSVRTYRKE